MYRRGRSFACHSSDVCSSPYWGRTQMMLPLKSLLKSYMPARARFLLLYSNSIMGTNLSPSARHAPSIYSNLFCLRGSMEFLKPSDTSMFSTFSGAPFSLQKGVQFMRREERGSKDSWHCSHRRLRLRQGCNRKERRRAKQGCRRF